LPNSANLEVLGIEYVQFQVSKSPGNDKKYAKLFTLRRKDKPAIVLKYGIEISSAPPSNIKKSAGMKDFDPDHCKRLDVYFRVTKTVVAKTGSQIFRKFETSDETYFVRTQPFYDEPKLPQ